MTEEFVCLVMEMRNAQKNYFSLKKQSGMRYPTPEVKRALAISKEIEIKVDKALEEFKKVDPVKKCKCGKKPIPGFDNCYDCLEAGSGHSFGGYF